MGSGLCRMSRSLVESLEKKGTPGRACSIGIEVGNAMSWTVLICHEHASRVCTVSCVHTYA